MVKKHKSRLPKYKKPKTNQASRIDSGIVPKKGKKGRFARKAGHHKNKRYDYDDDNGSDGDDEDDDEDEEDSPPPSTPPPSPARKPAPEKAQPQTQAEKEKQRDKEVREREKQREREAKEHDREKKQREREAKEHEKKAKKKDKNKDHKEHVSEEHDDDEELSRKSSEKRKSHHAEKSSHAAIIEQRGHKSSHGIDRGHAVHGGSGGKHKVFSKTAYEYNIFIAKHQRLLVAVPAGGENESLRDSEKPKSFAINTPHGQEVCKLHFTTGSCFRRSTTIDISMDREVIGAVKQYKHKLFITDTAGSPLFEVHGVPVLGLCNQMGPDRFKSDIFFPGESQVAGAIGRNGSLMSDVIVGEPSGFYFLARKSDSNEFDMLHKLLILSILIALMTQYSD